MLRDRRTRHMLRKEGTHERGGIPLNKRGGLAISESDWHYLKLRVPLAWFGAPTSEP